MNVKEYLAEVRECMDEVAERDGSIADIVAVIRDTKWRESTVFVMGNGGSAATASHFAQGLRDAGIRAKCLTDNVPTLTAIANDKDYMHVFGDVIEKEMTRISDVAVCISGSGNSPNVLFAARQATKIGIVVGLIGFGGGQLKELCHHSVVLSSKEYGPIEDVHLMLAHIIERALKDTESDEADVESWHHQTRMKRGGRSSHDSSH